jgi:hypothetical protein
MGAHDAVESPELVPSEVGRHAPCCAALAPTAARALAGWLAAQFEVSLLREWRSDFTEVGSTFFEGKAGPPRRHGRARKRGEPRDSREAAAGDLLRKDASAALTAACAQLPSAAWTARRDRHCGGWATSPSSCASWTRFVYRSRSAPAVRVSAPGSRGRSAQLGHVTAEQAANLAHVFSPTDSFSLVAPLRLGDAMPVAANVRKTAAAAHTDAGGRAGPPRAGRTGLARAHGRARRVPVPRSAL